MSIASYHQLVKARMVVLAGEENIECEVLVVPVGDARGVEIAHQISHVRLQISECCNETASQ